MLRSLTPVALLLLVPLSLPPPAEASHAAWASVAFDAVGDAGDWTAFRHPLPAGASQEVHVVSVSLALTGPLGPDAAAWLLLPAALAPDGRGGSHLLDVNVRLLTEDELSGGVFTYVVERTFPSAATEVAFAVAANRPWSASVVVTRLGDAGATAVPADVTSGEGFVFARSVGAPVAGVVSLEVPLAGAGWSTWDTRHSLVAPESVRHHDVRFPSGWGWSGPGLMAGVDTPILDYGGMVNHVDGGFSFPDAAGTFRAEVAYAHAGAELDVRFASVQGLDAAFPDVAIRVLFAHP